MLERRWVTLGDLIHQLPQASRTWAAVMNDPELAAQIVAAQSRDAHLDPGADVDDFADDADSGPGWHPPYEEYDLHAKQLGDLINAVAGLNQSIVAMAGGSPRRPELYPTPVTALPDARRDLAAADAEAIYQSLGIRDSVSE